jgi:NAD+ kinase
LVVVLGGDGTFLLTSNQVLHYEIPLLGVNFGHLGFLSEYGDISMQDLADEIADANYSIESRTVLKAQMNNSSEIYYALNDIAVNRSLTANLLHIDLYIDNHLLHSFRSDGIVISTPTGSTAYALSAGGAVMDPNIRAFQIVPIAAHSLNSRPQVVSDEQVIKLVAKDTNKNFYLQADGHNLVECQPETHITLSKAEKYLKLAKLNKTNKSFYQILRDKMKWGAINN